MKPIAMTLMTLFMLPFIAIGFVISLAAVAVGYGWTMAEQTIIKWDPNSQKKETP